MNCPPPGVGDDDLPTIRITNPNIYHPQPWPVTIAAVALGLVGATILMHTKKR